ncbi:GYDIA family GHMP kinase [Flagellimonas algicola]|uniref:GHMP kinase n=1 Tax=Flagellimonas algicola TaxID=2583815 RepID=A0ABY2WM41_9FLAO|nr:GYDIA family GHMP kinase [Allomuricauda algicola]TMU55582.1 GHMP kinase [Allomuricauda algicola]
MQQEYYSHGKLLLSGEYAILDGAVGLAVPTKFGQSLKLVPSSSPFLGWTSFDTDGQLWFEAEFEVPNLKLRISSDEKMANRLLEVLTAAQSLNPNFLVDGQERSVETFLTFPRDWGLGTSSTLINNMALWAKVDAHDLLQRTFGGSGYDLACAQHNSPLLYHLKDNHPTVQEVRFDPPFKENLFFVYLNEKRNSRDAIANYRSLEFDKAELIHKLTTITKNMAICSTLEEFLALMDLHEQTLSEVLKVPTVQNRLFPDFPKSIKSLGAWGGDFVMAAGTKKDQQYFTDKGYHTVLSYSDMVL